MNQGNFAVPTFLTMNINPISTKKRKSTFLMIAFASSCENVARNAALASGSSRNFVVWAEFGPASADLVSTAAWPLISPGTFPLLKLPLLSIVVETTVVILRAGR